jgi:hypothetical protein
MKGRRHEVRRITAPNQMGAASRWRKPACKDDGRGADLD